MNTIRAIIFDLDGVICFTDQYHYQAWKEMADAEGIYFDETINGRLRGVSRMESLDIILEKASREYTQEEKEQLAARKNESYVRLLEKMSPDDLSQEVKKTLEILRQRGYKLAIGSSSKNTKKILTQIGLNGYFDAISDGTNITKSKPDPEVFLKAAEMLGEKPENCLVVEDALAGYALKEDGFTGTGFMDTTRIAASGAEFWTDIAFLNRENLLKDMDGFAEEFQRLRDAVAVGDRQGLYALLDDARRKRVALTQKRVYLSEYTLDLDVKDEVGAISRVSRLLADNGINISGIQIIDSREGIGGALRIAVKAEADYVRAVRLLGVDDKR